MNMKTLKYGAFWMLAAPFLAFAGCEKAPEDFPGGDPGPIDVVLTASIETGDTKVGAEVDETTRKVAFKWTAGDAIAVQTASGFENFAYTGSASAASGEFSAAAEPLSEGIAVFPASVATSVSDNALTLELPASYTYDARQTNALLTASITPDNNLWFTHIGGLVAIGLKDIPAGAQLVFTAEGMKINGTYNVNIDSTTSTVDAVSTDTPSESTITISFPEAVAEGIAYFPVPVGYYASWKGQILGPDQTVLLELERESAQAERAVATAFNDVPEVMLDLAEWFVTPAGTGKKDGSSWDNAMGVAELRTMLAQRVDAEGAQIDNDAHAVALILDGDTFHMAAGDYYLAGEAGAQVKVEFTDYEKEVAMTFLGGYPANLTGTTKEGRNAETNVTAFTGNKEAGIFLFGNQVAPAFDGITFKDANFDSSDGGAVYARAGGSGNITLNLKNCRFIDNKNSESRTGAALYLHKAVAVIDGCYFSGNYARNGSAIAAASAEGKVTVSNCTFENNSTFNTSGAVQNGGRTMDVISCTFKNNNAGSWGGAFHANGEGAVTVLSKCKFIENKSGKQGGAVSIQVADCTFNECEFTGNRADRAVEGDNGKSSSKAGGAIFLNGEGSKCTLNACTFTGNMAPNGCAGAILCSEKAVLTINAGTTFTGNSSLYDGGAIYADNVFAINGTSESKVVFSGNKTLATGSGEGNGGAIYVWLRNDAEHKITNVLFTGNEAGQESGTTVNYSNGGGIYASGKVGLTIADCEFTDNRARNGGCIAHNSSLASKITRCNFHDNVCRSGANKDGSNGNGNFNGAALQQGNGTIEFTQCVFNKNIVQGSSSVLHMNGEKNNTTAYFTDCQFIENKSFGNNGCIKMEKAGEKLYLNRCVFRGNSSASRGIINPNGNTLLFMNDVTFKDNFTTTGQKSWGVAIHQGQANVCMNNVTAHNNHNTASDPTSVISFNGDGGWLITNSTIADKTPYAIIRVGNAAGHLTLCNNILINSLTAAKVFEVAAETQFDDKGHNIMSCEGTHGKCTPVESDRLNQTETTLAGTYSEVLTGSHPYGVYSWTNALEGFSAATAADVYAAISGYTRADSVVGSTNIGADFWNWLKQIGAAAETEGAYTFKDARGVARTGTMWPGAYQAN